LAVDLVKMLSSATNKERGLKHFRVTNKTTGMKGDMFYLELLADCCLPPPGSCLLSLNILNRKTSSLSTVMNNGRQPNFYESVFCFKTMNFLLFFSQHVIKISFKPFRSYFLTFFNFFQRYVPESDPGQHLDFITGSS
jgi:hypothetical protein